MNVPLRGIAVYNPALLSKDELVAQFVARKGLLDTILSELRTQERPGHRILLGPRGMGKTTLLRRIYFAVEEEPVLSKRWIALPFPEEQYNLTRLSDFYLNCVDALGDALMHLGRVAEAEALDKARDALPDGDEEERAAAARDLLLSMADKLRRKLLLLVDSVEMVLDRLASSQWALRELLGHDARLCLIGASAFAPESTFEYKQAFYEFFRFHDLRPLQETEARDLLLHLARLRGAPEVERIVNNEPARVRTLLTLSGGNPRTLVQLYAVLSQSANGDARSDLERLLDECTPIYKARFEALSVQAQQIVDAVALHWHPVTAAEVAAVSRLDINAVSSQLSRLLKEGTLEAVQAPEGTRKAFQVTERFFNIWYLMRASRRQRQRLAWLVEFLRLFYSQEELPAHARQTLGRDERQEPGSLGRDAEYRMALAQTVQDRALRRALVSSAIRPWAENDGHRDKLTELLDLAPDETPARPIADRHRAMADLRKKILKAKVKKKGWDAAVFWELLGGSLISVERKIAMGEQIEQAAARTIGVWTSSLEEEAEKLKKLLRCDAAVGALRRAIREGHMNDADDVEGGEAAALLFNCPELTILVLGTDIATTETPEEPALLRLRQALHETPRMAYGWFVLARARQDASQFDQAEEAYRGLFEQDPTHAGGWCGFGVLLFVGNDAKRYDEAEAAFRKAIQNDADSADAWYWLSCILMGHADRLGEAESACRRAIALDDSDPWKWIQLGRLLLIERSPEAEEAYRKAVELDPEQPEAWRLLGELQEAQDRYAEAEDAYRRATSTKKADGWVWLRLGKLLGAYQGRTEETEHAYRSAMAFEPTRPHALFQLTWNRRVRGLTDAETERLARDLVRTDPDPGCALILAGILVCRGLWDEPARLARDALAQATPEGVEAVWGVTLDFFADVVRCKGAADALGLLEDLGFSERWLPLRAALTAVRDGRRALAGFAPEVRRPAEALLARLQPTAAPPALGPLPAAIPARAISPAPRARAARKAPRTQHRNT